MRNMTKRTFILIQVSIDALLIQNICLIYLLCFIVSTGNLSFQGILPIKTFQTSRVNKNCVCWEFAMYLKSDLGNL